MEKTFGNNPTRRAYTLPALVFEKMQLADLQQVMAIENEAFTSPWSASYFRIGLRKPKPNEHFYVARKPDEHIVGYVVFRIICDEGHLYNLAVAAAYRRRGIAKYLLTATLEMIAARGGRQVFLEVDVANVAAHALYRQFGFRICRIRKNYYGFRQDAYVLRLADAQLTCALGENGRVP